MKQFLVCILAISIMMGISVEPANRVEAGIEDVTEGAPPIISYQGQVSIVGLPFNGPGFFKFAIIDPPGTTSFWSNDGTSTGGNEPTNSISLPVTNGLFNVHLGDPSGGMPPITEIVFSEPNRLLRVWFSADGSTFDLLAPDTLITAVPYALQAQVAMNSLSLGGYSASDFLTTPQYLGRRWGNRADTTDNAGQYSSIAIGADGLGLISYYEYNYGDLKVLHCGNLLCNGGNTITTVDSAADVGVSSSITIGADGLGLISYYDYTNHDLKVLHCGNLLCNSGNTIFSADTTGDVGGMTSITIGVDGLGLISYISFTGYDLKVLHCGNLACNSGNTITTVDADVYVGQLTTSITIAGDGLGLIAYWDIGNLDLKVLHCGNQLCNSGNTITSVDMGGDVGGYSAIITGADGLGLIAYYDNTNGDLKVLHCGNPSCNAGNTTTFVDTNGIVGLYPSITVGPDGLGLISYQDQTNLDLKLLHCGNQSCNAGNASATIDAAGDVGQYSSITIGSDGLALISYYDQSSADLKVIKMSGLGRR